MTAFPAAASPACRRNISPACLMVSDVPVASSPPSAVAVDRGLVFCNDAHPQDGKKNGMNFILEKLISLMYVKHIPGNMCILLLLTDPTINGYFMVSMPKGMTPSVNSGPFIYLMNMFSFFFYLFYFYFYFRQLIQLLYATEIIVNPFDIPTATFQHLSTLLLIMTLFNDLLVIFSSCSSQLS